MRPGKSPKIAIQPFGDRPALAAFTAQFRSDIHDALNHLGQDVGRGFCEIRAGSKNLILRPTSVTTTVSSRVSWRRSSGGWWSRVSR